MSNLVVYRNELNTIALKKFNSKEMDLLFSICSQMRNRDIETITFNFDELRKLSDYKYTAHDRFIKDIEGVYDKLLQLNIKTGTAIEFTKFVLFTEYTVSAENETVTIQVNDKFKYILNNISRNFTKFELEEFITLNSSYSKTAYRLLKQFRSTGYYKVKIDEFRRLFDVPSSYKMCDIDKRVLAPIEKELPQYFKNLKITKLRGKGKRKRFVEYIEFKFEPEREIKDGTKTCKDNGTCEHGEMDFDELKKEMGLSEENYTEREIYTLFQSALDKVLQSNSEVDVFEYVRLCNEYVRKQSDVKNKYNCLAETIRNDYGKNLKKRYRENKKIA